MRGPSDKRLQEMKPSDRFDSLKKYILEYLDWLLATSHQRATSEPVVDLRWFDGGQWDQASEEIGDLAESLHEYASALEQYRAVRLQRLAKGATLVALEQVTIENGYSAGEVENAQRALARKRAR